jgi:hypothetical protein
MGGLFRFIICSYSVLVVTHLTLFIWGFFLQISVKEFLFLDLEAAAVVLAAIIMIYYFYDRRINKVDSRISEIQVFPYEYHEFSAFIGMFSLLMIFFISVGLFTTAVTWNFLLVFTGFEFCIIGWILGYLMERVPGAIVNDIRKEGVGKAAFPYHLTQLYYYFLYTAIGITLIVVGIFVGISRLPE